MMIFCLFNPLNQCDIIFQQFINHLLMDQYEMAARRLMPNLSLQSIHPDKFAFAVKNNPLILL